MKTRVINCAKVTREWPEDFVDPSSKLLGKLKKLIKKHAPEKHAIVSVKDEPPKRTPDNLNKALSSLDKKLTSLRKKGARVVGFWRDGGKWQIKVMRGLTT